MLPTARYPRASCQGAAYATEKDVGTYSNGDVYEGSFENGFRQGYGEYRYSGGAVYKGNWVDGVQNGDGCFKDKLGEYTGSFSGGVFSGQGTYKYANGDVYTGTWKNGKPHGTGKLTSGGEVYEGSFTNGVINGSGQKTFANGDIVKGTFTNGKLERQRRILLQNLRLLAQGALRKRQACEVSRRKLRWLMTVAVIGSRTLTVTDSQLAELLPAGTTEIISWRCGGR